LHICSITRTDSGPAFTLDVTPAFPVTLHPGETVEYSIKYEPTDNDDEKATFQVQSDDPRSPRRLKATGSHTGFFSRALAIVLYSSAWRSWPVARPLCMNWRSGSEQALIFRGAVLIAPATRIWIRLDIRTWSDDRKKT
jgi:hypothetical protein